MADVEAMKQARSKAKQTVTVSARRLITTAERDADMDVLKTLLTELEKAYSDFVSLNEAYEDLVSSDIYSEHRTVNGESLSQYQQTVFTTYKEGRDKFIQIKQNEQFSLNMSKAAPIRRAIKRSLTQMHNLLEEIDSNLSSFQPDVNVLKEGMSELDEILLNTYKHLDELYNLIGSEADMDQSEVDTIADIINGKRRKVKLCISKVHVQESRPPCIVSSIPLPLSSVNVTRPESTFVTHSSNYVNPLPSFDLNTSMYSAQPSTAGSLYSNMPVFPPRYSFPGNDFRATPSYSAWPSTGTPFNPTSSGSFTRHSQNDSMTGNHQIHRDTGFSDIKLKRLELPTFSGERKDWPEFKAVWRELAEGSHMSKTALAHELKQSVRGEAAQRIKAVYATKPEAYDIMWQKLETYYDDTSASVQSALDSLQNLKLVKDDDFKALVSLIDSVEGIYSQLELLGQLNTLTMRDVDQITASLPTHVRYEWIRKFQHLTPEEKLKPFTPFMLFLECERQAVSRLADVQPTRKPESFKERNRATFTNQTQVNKTDNDSKGKAAKKFYLCAYPAHRRDGVKHVTENCNEFKKLPIGGKEGKLECLRQINACFICFGDHRRNKCPDRKLCQICNKTEHHLMLCYERDTEKKPEPNNSSSNHIKKVDSHITEGNTLALYAIQQARIPGTGKQATVFCDGGSNSTYITQQAADRLHAKKLNRLTLDVTTMGDVQKTYDTRQYAIKLQTQSGKIVDIVAFGMEKITGRISKLDIDVLSRLFPQYDVTLLQRYAKSVDILLGCDNFGLHPKTEVTKAGDNLSIMQGDFGVCLQGTHPELREETTVDNNLARIIHGSKSNVQSFHVLTSYQSHLEFDTPSCPQYCRRPFCYNFTKNELGRVDSFIKGEELATETTPRCGGCKCNKCPTVGHTYSFKEEQQLKMIQDNLRYDETRKCWVTSYPWLVDPRSLPDNYDAALCMLRNTEHKLLKDLKWASTYQAQIQDMLDRKVARRLSPMEISTWTGPKFYISHLAVLNQRSQSTPVRIVFNSSQLYKGVSLNSCLAKGPDAYLNNLIGLLLRWRERPVAVVGDIKKMFNSVYLEELETHCHRFLWRDLKQNKQPDIYVIERVNMGDTPAPAISCEAIYKTADLFREDSPRAAELLRKSSYVDDLIDSFDDITEANTVTNAVETILHKGGFTVKCWQFSGELGSRANAQQSERSTQNSPTQVKTLLKGSGENLRVLGLGWKPKEDIQVFEVALNFSRKKKGVRTEENLKREDLPKAVPFVLTKRMVLEQVMAIYDPLGFVCPFTLLAKVYLREIWDRKYGWDEQLPDDLRSKWVNFFVTMFQLEELKLPRCLYPSETTGRPWLVILSDGSDIAYGFAAYIVWRLKDGSNWSRLIMAKCRIAPLKKLSTPQMELNAAVLSKRARIIIEKEMRFDFERVLHLVDSETVLNMLNKTSTRFKIYEGVRIGEIQAASDGDMSCWAWISGSQNTADWLTRGRTLNHLGADTEWYKGPTFLREPVQTWNLKFGLQRDSPLPGEKKLCTSTTVATNTHLIDYSKYSSIDRIIWVVAKLRNIGKKRSFSGGRSELVTPELIREADDFIVKDIQSTIYDELQKSNSKTGVGGRYARLAPIQKSDGIWVVGEQLQRYNAMTAGSELQKLIPAKHPGTRLFMERVHKNGHRGRNATLALFRQHFCHMGTNLQRV